MGFLAKTQSSSKGAKVSLRLMYWPWRLGENFTMLNIYLSYKICKAKILTIIFPVKFFHSVWIPLTRRAPQGTFLLSFSHY